MAVVARAPGDNADKSQYSIAQYDDGYDTASWSSNRVPSAELNLQDYTVKVLSSGRSSYPKGSVITLPGGSKFIKSTAYNTSTTELVVAGAHEINRYSEVPGYSRGNARVYDSGRYAGALLGNYGIISNSIPTDMRNEAVTKALNKLADQKVNLGENFATFGQTVRLFSSKAGLLAAALKAAKNKDAWRKYLRKSARDLSRRGSLETAAQEYLAYIYGLRPLMQDVYNARETVRALESKTLLLKGVGRAIRSTGASQTSFATLATGALSSRLGGSGTRRVKCTLWARPDPNFQGLRALNQLGLSNPLGLAWDLIPWSFCVDWLLPVGPVLYALSARMGLIFVDGSISCRASEDLIFEYRVNSANFGSARSRYDPDQVGQCIVSRNYEGYSRQTITSWPLPGLWIDADPLRGDRPFKALALLIAGLKR